jgi:hypothetical protein
VIKYWAKAWAKAMSPNFPGPNTLTKYGTVTKGRMKFTPWSENKERKFSNNLLFSGTLTKLLILPLT